MKTIRQAGAIAAVSEIQRRSIELGTDEISLEEINAEIATIRRARHLQGNNRPPAI